MLQNSLSVFKSPLRPSWVKGCTDGHGSGCGWHRQSMEKLYRKINNLTGLMITRDRSGDIYRADTAVLWFLWLLFQPAPHEELTRQGGRGSFPQARGVMPFHSLIPACSHLSHLSQWEAEMGGTSTRRFKCCFQRVIIICQSWRSCCYHKGPGFEGLGDPELGLDRGSL